MNLLEKFSGKNTQYAGLALGWGWLKASNLLRFLDRIPLDLKTVKRSPKSKLEDLLACLMAGVVSLGQIDVGMRRDPGLAGALGRERLSLVYCRRFREPLDVFLHPGNTNSAGPLREIVLSLEDAYEWVRPVRQRIAWRLDSGYGSDGKLSWLMRRGYRSVAKGYSGRRAAKWALAVDPSGWKPVGKTQDVSERGRIPSLTSPHRCLLVRTLRTKKPGYKYSYLVSNLDAWARPKGHVLFYNKRQGIEREIQQIKAVLGLKHKRKRSFKGMEALALMTLMANLLLARYRKELGVTDLGLKRFIREVVRTPGIVVQSGSRAQIHVEPQAKFFQLLSQWKPQVPLPLYLSQIGGILYKN